MVGIGVERGRVNEFAHLCAHRLDHVRIVVTDAGGEDAAEEIEIAVALHIPHVEPFAVVKRQGIGVVEDMVGP